MTTKKTKEPERPAESPAPAKTEGSRPAAAAAEVAKPGPMFSTPPPKAEGPRPLMSSELPRPAEPKVAPADFSKAVQSATEWGDKSPLGFLQRNATAAELEGFVAAVKARQTVEKGKPLPVTFWRCPHCGRQERGSVEWDGKKDIPCFFCNPRLFSNGQHMVQVVDAAGIAAFLEREKREKEAWQKSLAKAKELAQRLEAERGLLRRHGM